MKLIFVQMHTSWYMFKTMHVILTLRWEPDQIIFSVMFCIHVKENTAMHAQSYSLILINYWG